jgi:cytochrome c biogenesis protein ResB
MLYKFFSSLKSSVYILLFMCLIFLIGTIFPQGGNIDDYIEAGGKYITLVRFLDFLDIFASPLFLGITVVLIINLSVCLFDRCRIFLKIKRKPVDFRSLKQHSQTASFNNGDIMGRLRKMGFKLKAETRDAAEPGVKIFEKGVPYWWLSWFYHLGIILAIVGFFLTMLFAFEQGVLLYPGQPETISLSSSETVWNKFLEKLGQKTTENRNENNYILTLKEFRTEYYQGLKIDYPDEKLERLALGLGINKLEPSTEGFSYMPKMWLTKLVVKKPDGKVMDAALWVNKPFRTGGLTLYQMGYEQKIDLRVNGIAMEVEARVPFTVDGVEGKFALGSLKTGELFKKDGSSEEITPVTTVYFIPEDDASAKKGIGELNFGGTMEFNGTLFEFADYKEGSYLSYRNDPGVWLVGFACLFVFLGLIVRNLGAWYRIQCAFEKKIAYVLISTRGILADKDRIIRKLKNKG